MNIEICKYKNGANCAFSFTFDDGCYYDSSREAMEIFENLYKSTGIKIKATVGITVNFMHERLIDLWREGIRRGYFDIASHTVGHDIAFSSDTPYERRESDAKNAQAWLREVFEGEGVNTFIFAGGSRDSEGSKVLEDYYFACRAGDYGINHVGKINWLDVRCLTAMLAKPFEYYTDYIDKTILEGGWGVQMNHWLTHKSEDVFHSQGAEQFIAECDYLAQKAKGGRIWIGSFEEVGAYLRKYENSTLKVSERDGKLCAEIMSNLDTPSAILNTPLTISIDTDKDILLYGKKGEVSRLSPNEQGKIYISTSDFIEFEPVLE